MAAKKDFLTEFTGSAARAKVLRHLLLTDECITLDELAKRAQLTKPIARKEVTFLEKLGVIKKALCVPVEVQQPQEPEDSKKPKAVKKPVVKKPLPGYRSNAASSYFPALRAFVRNVSPQDKEHLVDALKPAGRVRLVITSGVFMGDRSTRADLLVVGENINEPKLVSALRMLEAEMGHEIRYVYFPVDEFRYRINVYDRLVRDILDYPHEILFDQLKIALSPGEE